MRKLLLTFVTLAIAASSMAIPAKKGIWTTLKLSDGTEIRAQLEGDEQAHWWKAEDGTLYREANDEIVTVADFEQIKQQVMSRRNKAKARQSGQRRKVSIGEQTHYTGKKKGIVILVEFSNVSFRAGNTLEKYKRIMNEEGYSEGSFKGSVADYFKAQSGGKFELAFDVVGPYKLSQNQSYYGANDSYGNDQRPEEMIIEAVNAADEEVNFKDYDWDGDGEVDQVFVLYAGKGEADGGYGNANTIWPHMWYLEETNDVVTLDGVRINSYACSNEIDGSYNIEGIGVFCHEFSHCMGFPDFYDVSYGGWFGMGSWDLMDTGSYNGDGFRPAGYSAYEKWMSGWLEPIELDKEYVEVENLAPISEGGEGYIIYNDGNRNEYYMVENRQKTNWDSSLPGRGLMITHVDFDKTIWEQNTPNSRVTSQDVYSGYYDKTNDHQRFTIFHADNTASAYNETTDLYPYGKKDSLTNTSTPYARVYNNNTDGKKYMNKPIRAIKQNSDRTMSFSFGNKKSEDKPGPDATDSYLFYESFDKCSGKGGNDGNWTTTIATADFKPDNEGWSSAKAFGAYQCAKFGSGSAIGIVTTPSIKLGDGEATLTFMATSWNADGTQLNLEVSGNAMISPSVVEMKSFEWTEFTCTITGTGTTTVTFTPVKRFLLDEVKLVKKEKQTPTGISTIDNGGLTIGNYVYDLQGRRVEHPTKGIYIINGKKTIIK